MTTFQIKIIAIITMIIDHIGLFFFPQYIFLRMIGRLSFPLFAWLIANGAYHTHNIKAYLLRLLFFAFIAQLPFMLVKSTINPSFNELNVLFTLFLGLVAIAAKKHSNHTYVFIITVVICAVIAQIINTDYGAFGVLSVIFFYIYYKKFSLMVISQIVIYCFPSIYLLLTYYENHISAVTYLLNFIEPLGVLSLFFISCYNKKEGLKAKYLFYILYPLQYVVFYLIRLSFYSH